MSLESGGAREPLWTKNYILIIFNNLLMFLVHHTLFTAIPLFMQGLGSPNYMMGLSTTVLSKNVDKESILAVEESALRSDAQPM